MLRNHRPHGPALMERPLTFEEVKGHRHLACGLYQICLEVVVRRQWPSFSCRPCSLWPRRGYENEGTGPAQVLEMPLAGQR